ncbi:unnamed protein product [Paramecium sonneborni]|uniref:Tetratricopeptide repeat protein n=1 Tax=Paramecium sonneborni TaxID=65129 RepID=A0A8S1RWP8_9CILI|nr:unnamed protein product [Paramecium sonneborni]
MKIMPLIQRIKEIQRNQLNFLQMFKKKKYQQSKENLLQLNAKQLNQVLDWAINYDENKISLLEDLKKSSDDIIELLNIKITELELEELNKLEQEKEQELYYKRIIFYDDRKQQEVITQLDFTLFNDPINLNEIFPNPYSLRMFGNQDNANIWADQVLSIDSNHVNSLFIKAESLRMLENYNDSIIWADKALSIDSKHVNSLFTKGNSLRKLNKYYEALKFLDQVLIINPNNHTALYSKGAQLLLFRLSLIKRECNIVN